MANCAVCSVELGFTNKVPLGIGNLSTGETLCLKCCEALQAAGVKDPPGKLTLAQVQPVIAIKRNLSNQTVEKSAVVLDKNTRVKAQLEKIGVTQSSSAALWGRKEMAELPNLISENEEIFALAQGRYNKREGLLVATSQRLLFIEKGLLYGLKVEDFGLRTITSIQFNSGLLFADITILANGNAEKITDVYKDSARTFCDKVRAKLNDLTQPVAATTTVINHAAPVDVADQLQKLAGLKAQGILTQEEFDAQKKKLLGL